MEALRSQVKEHVVLLQAFLRQERAGRCSDLSMSCAFPHSRGERGGLVATIDVDPEQYAALERIDHGPDVRPACGIRHGLYSGSGWDAMISKK